MQKKKKKKDRCGMAPAGRPAVICKCSMGILRWYQFRCGELVFFQLRPSCRTHLHFVAVLWEFLRLEAP